MRLFDFVRSLLPRIQKNEVVEDLRISLGELNNNVVPAYSDAAAFFKEKKLASESNSELSTMFYRNYELAKSNKSANFVLEIESKLTNVRENLEFVTKLNEDLLEDDIIKEGLTAKKAILIRSAEQLSFLTRFSIDLLNYVYSKETEAAGSTTGTLLAVQIKQIEGNVGNFARVLGVFGEESKKFKAQFDTMPEVVVNEKTHQAISAVYENDKLDPFGNKFVHGFEGNPIYHFRIMIAEWQADRYKNAKDKKRMLELRLLNLKLLQENGQDPKLDREIEYIQNRIESLEFKMSKMEQAAA